MGKAPDDAQERWAVKPVICYPNETLPAIDLRHYEAMRQSAQKIDEIIILPRDARCFSVPAGHFFRISAKHGPQVGDLNLFHAANLKERFYSGKTRALHGTHISTGERMWSSFPYLRAMATITTDTLDWYGVDEFGGSVHDVIGTRCDPYTGNLLQQSHYHHCCHSNLTRALSDFCKIEISEAEAVVHDVLNVFMCTGFTRDTGQYFMKASPVRPDDYLELIAEIDLIGALSACPGGDCGDEHSSDVAKCQPLTVEVFAPDKMYLDSFQQSEVNGYDGSHGL